MSIVDERLKQELNLINDYYSENPYATPEEVLKFYVDSNADDEDFKKRISELSQTTNNPYQILAEALKYKASDTSLGEEFVAGFKSSLATSAYDIGLIGKALYNKAYNYITGEDTPLTEGNILSGLRQYAEKNAPSIQSLDQVKDLSSFGRFAMGGLGNTASFFLPIFGEEVISERLLGRGLAELVERNLIKKTIDEAVASGVERKVAPKLLSNEIDNILANSTKAKIANAIGRGALPYASMSGVEAGEILKNQIQAGDVNLNRALLGGAIAGALEYLPYEYFSGKIFGRSRKLLTAPADASSKRMLGMRALNMVKQGAIGGTFEGLTEGMQTLTERFFGNQDIQSQQAINEYINSIALGMIGGAGMGAFTGVLDKIQRTDPNANIQPQQEEQTPALTQTLALPAAETGELAPGQTYPGMAEPTAPVPTYPVAGTTIGEIPALPGAIAEEPAIKMYNEKIIPAEEIATSVTKKGQVIPPDVITHTPEKLSSVLQNITEKNFKEVSPVDIVGLVFDGKAGFENVFKTDKIDFDTSIQTLAKAKEVKAILNEQNAPTNLKKKAKEIENLALSRIKETNPFAPYENLKEPYFKSFEKIYKRLPDKPFEELTAVDFYKSITGTKRYDLSKAKIKKSIKTLREAKPFLDSLFNTNINQHPEFAKTVALFADQLGVEPKKLVGEIEEASPHFLGLTSKEAEQRLKAQEKERMLAKKFEAEIAKTKQAELSARAKALEQARNKMTAVGADTLTIADITKGAKPNAIGIMSNTIAKMPEIVKDTIANKVQNKLIESKGLSVEYNHEGKPFSLYYTNENGSRLVYLPKGKTVDTLQKGDKVLFIKDGETKAIEVKSPTDFIGRFKSIIGQEKPASINLTSKSLEHLSGISETKQRVSQLRDTYSLLNPKETAKLLLPNVEEKNLTPEKINEVVDKEIQKVDKSQAERIPIKSPDKKTVLVPKKVYKDMLTSLKRKVNVFKNLKDEDAIAIAKQHIPDFEEKYSKYYTLSEKDKTALNKINKDIKTIESKITALNKKATKGKDAQIKKFNKQLETLKKKRDKIQSKVKPAKEVVAQAIREEFAKALKKKQEISNKLGSVVHRQKQTLTEKIKADYEAIKDLYLKNDLTVEKLKELIVGNPNIKLKDLSIIDFAHTVAETEALLNKLLEEKYLESAPEDIAFTKAFYEIKGEPFYKVLANNNEALTNFVKEINNTFRNLLTSVSKKYKPAISKKLINGYLKTFSILKKEYKANLDDLMVKTPKAVFTDFNEFLTLYDLTDTFGKNIQPEIIEPKDLIEEEKQLKSEIRDLISIKEKNKRRFLVSPGKLEDLLLTSKNYSEQLYYRKDIDKETKTATMLALNQYYKSLKNNLLRAVISKIDIESFTRNFVPPTLFELDNNIKSQVIDESMVALAAKEAYDELDRAVTDEIKIKLLNRDLDKVITEAVNTKNLVGAERSALEAGAPQDVNLSLLNISAKLNEEDIYSYHGLTNMDLESYKQELFNYVSEVISKIGITKIHPDIVESIRDVYEVLSTNIEDLPKLSSVSEVISKADFETKYSNRISELYKKYKNEIDKRLKTAQEYFDKQLKEFKNKLKNKEISSKDYKTFESNLKKSLRKTKRNIVLNTAYEKYLEKVGNTSLLTILSKKSYFNQLRNNPNYAKLSTEEFIQKAEQQYKNYLKRQREKLKNILVQRTPIEKISEAFKKISPDILRDIVFTKDHRNQGIEDIATDTDLKYRDIPININNLLRDPKAMRDLDKALAGISTTIDNMLGGFKNLINLRFVKFASVSDISNKELKSILKIAYGWTEEQLAKLTPVRLKEEYQKIKGFIQSAPLASDFAATVTVALGAHDSLSDLSRTIMHETFHFFDRANLLSKEDIKLLKDYFSTDTISWNENAADAFALYMETNILPKGRLGRIFAAIKAFLTKLGNFLRGHGFRSIEGIFYDIYSGKTIKNKYKEISSHDEFMLHVRNSLSRFRKKALRIDEPIIHSQEFEEAEKYIHNSNPDYRTTLSELRAELRQKGLNAAATTLLGKMRNFKEEIMDLFFRGAMPKIYKAETAKEWEVLREAMNIPNLAMAKTTRLIKEIIGDMSKFEYDLFNKILVLRDVVKNVEKGIQTEKAALEQFNFIYSDFNAIKAHLSFLENKAKANPKILKALDRRNRILQEIIDDLYEKGYFKSRFNAEDYFHRAALFNYKLGQNKGIIPKGMKLNFKAFLQKRTNATEMFVTEYVLSEYEILSQAISLQEQHRLIEKMNKVYDKDMQELMKIFKQASMKEKGLRQWYQLFSPKYKRKYLKDKKWDDFDAYMLADYQIAVPGIKLSKRVFAELQKKAIEQGEAEAVIDIDLDDLNFSNFVVNIRRPILVRKAVAETMDSFMEFNNPVVNKAQGIFKKHITALKRNLILNPTRALHYMINNLAGDIDKVNILDPKILKSHAPQALRDLKAYFDYLDGSRKTPLSKELVKEIEDAIAKGVINSGLTAAEMPEIVTTEQLKELLGYYDNSLVASYWRKIGKVNNIRESVLRLAVWRYIKQKMKEGKDFGALASKAEVYNNLESLEDKAAMLARDLLGDYANISPMGQFIRSYAIPFWSWMEINLPTYVRVFKNTIKEGYAQEGVFGAFKNVVKRTVLMSTLYSAVMIYNLLMFPDDWEDAMEANRGQLHLILGKKKDGSLVTIRAQSALADALQWFGFEEAPMYTLAYGIPGFILGEKDLQTAYKNKIKSFVKEAPTAGINKVAQGFMPDVVALLESLGGYSFYPDITNWRPLRNPIDPFLRLAGMKRIVDQMGFYPERPSSRGIVNSFLTMLWQTVGYDNFPEENRYFRAVNLGKEFLRVNNLSSGKFSANTSPKANAAYYFKKALMYGDYDGAEKFLAEYFALGGTLKSLKKSLQHSHPLAGIPNKYRGIFMKSLTPRDRQMVNEAIEWYENVFIKHKKIPEGVWTALIRRAMLRAKRKGILKVNKSPYDIVF